MITIYMDNEKLYSKYVHSRFGKPTWCTWYKANHMRWKLIHTLSDVERKEAFKEIVQESLRYFVQAHGEYTNEQWLSKEIQEPRVLSALIYFSVALYDHILADTEYLLKHRRDSTNILKNALSQDLYTLSSYVWLNSMCKEKDATDLAKIAHDVVYDIITTLAKTEKNWNTRTNLHTLEDIISTMEYPLSPWTINRNTLPSTTDRNNFEIGKIYDGVINTIHDKLVYMALNKENTIRWKIIFYQRHELQWFEVGQKIQVKVEENPAETLLILSLVPTKE